MNFLAHFHLAWPDEGLIAGGLEGDYYKGRLGPELPDDLARGIRLHRAIDAFTDDHQRVRALRREFPPRLRRYAGILIDLSFDHFLTLHWSRYADLPLAEFNRRVLVAIALRQEYLSPASRGMLARLRDYDILNRYHEWRTVTVTAERIGERFRRGNPLRQLDSPLADIRCELEAAFLDFYPDLRAFTAEAR